MTIFKQKNISQEGSFKSSIWKILPGWEIAAQSLKRSGVTTRLANDQTQGCSSIGKGLPCSPRRLVYKEGKLFHLQANNSQHLYLKRFLNSFLWSDRLTNLHLKFLNWGLFGCFSQGASVSGSLAQLKEVGYIRFLLSIFSFPF